MKRLLPPTRLFRAVCFFWACFFGSIACGPYAQNFFNDWKEYTHTKLASAMSGATFSEEQEIDIFVLYQEIISADRDCGKIQEEIEDNETLLAYEKLFGFKKGFLFDEFMDFEYTKAVTTPTQDPRKMVALSVAAVWKQETSLEDLRMIIEQIRKCYPREY